MSRKILYSVSFAVVSCFVAASANATTLSQPFDVDTTDMAADYPQYTYTNGYEDTSHEYHVEDGVLHVSPYDIYNLHSNHYLHTDAGGLASPLSVSVDLGGVGDAGNFSEGIFLSSGADWLQFVFHPGFTDGAFRITAYDGTTTGNLNLGFTPAMGTLHHIAVDYDGEGQFDVTFTDGDNPANVFNYHYEDTRLDGSMLITGLYSHGNQIYAEVWNYDNWIIDFTDLISGDANRDFKVDEDDAAVIASNWLQPGDWSKGDFNNDGIVNDVDATMLATNWHVGVTVNSAVPEPSTSALLLSILLSVLFVRIKQRKGANA